MVILHVRLVTCIPIVTETLQGFSFLSPVYRQDSKGRRGHVSSLSSGVGRPGRACGRPWFQQWCHLPLAASSYTTSLIKEGKNQNISQAIVNIPY